MTVPQSHVDYAQRLLYDGWFEGWFVTASIHNVLHSIYTDEWYPGGLYFGGRDKFSKDAEDYVAAVAADPSVKWSWRQKVVASDK
jgi:hypothetical protein